MAHQIELSQPGMASISLLIAHNMLDDQNNISRKIHYLNKIQIKQQRNNCLKNAAL